jgi:hypothetical protein
MPRERRAAAVHAQCRKRSVKSRSRKLSAPRRSPLDMAKGKALGILIMALAAVLMALAERLLR